MLVGATRRHFNKQPLVGLRPVRHGYAASEANREDWLSESPSRGGPELVLGRIALGAGVGSPHHAGDCAGCFGLACSAGLAVHDGRSMPADLAVWSGCVARADSNSSFPAAILLWIQIGLLMSNLFYNIPSILYFLLSSLYWFARRCQRDSGSSSGIVDVYINGSIGIIGSRL